MDSAQIIRNAVLRVTALRELQAADPALAARVQAVKTFQARRFAGTYADLLAGGSFQAAARFFLQELYCDKDFSERDAQFSRIAGALQAVFPGCRNCRFTRPATRTDGRAGSPDGRAMGRFARRCSFAAVASQTLPVCLAAGWTTRASPGAVGHGSGNR